MTLTHVMLDIETLGTRPGFVVLSAACVRFTDLAATSVALSVPEQQALGLEIDSGTVEWWQQQSPAALAAATQNAIPLRPALDHIAAWLTWARQGGDLFVWGHGAAFDAPLLGEVYRRAGIATPWTFRDLRDTRTLYDLSGVDPRNFNHGTPQVALGDAIAQTKAAVEALRVLAARRAAA